MKIRTLFAALLLTFSLPSCLELKDVITIYDNGGGKFFLTTDMAQMIDIISASDEKEAQVLKNGKINKTYSLKDILKNDKTFGNSQKKLLEDGIVKVKVNFEKKEYNTEALFMFSKIEDLGKVMNATNNGSFIPRISVNSALDIEETQDASQPDLDKILNVFELSTSEGRIARTVNEQRHKALMTDPNMSSFREGADLGMSIPRIVIYNLPRPVKSVTHAGAKISADKKTVEITENILEVISKPEAFKYTITY